MATNFIEHGDQVRALAPAGGVVSGEFYLIEGVALVALTTAEAGEDFTAKLRGAFKLPLTGGATFGQRVYYDAGALTLTPGGVEIGFALTPKLGDELGVNEAVVCLGVHTIPFVAAGGGGT